MSSSNRRAHQRLSLTAKGWIAVAASEGDWHPISTVDVSKGGFSFVSDKSIAVNAICQFRLQLPNDAGLMHVLGRIAHCQDVAESGGYRIGVQAVSVNVVDVAAMLMNAGTPQANLQPGSPASATGGTLIAASIEASSKTQSETPASILEFWFGQQTDDAAVAAEKSKLWWAKDTATDALMLARFAPMLDMAANGALDEWAATPRGRLALILLTDQFPRNIYRNTPHSFGYDGLARAWCKEGLALGVDQQLRPIERVFYYLPLEHSESLEDQHQAVALFERLLQVVPPEQKTVFAGFLDFAVRHRVIVERFGRFPHRNAILGRPSSVEEVAFLQEKGSAF